MVYTEKILWTQTILEGDLYVFLYWLGTYSKTLAAEIINMNDNVIIPQTSLKSGMIAAIPLYYKVVYNL